MKFSMVMETVLLKPDLKFSKKQKMQLCCNNKVCLSVFGLHSIGLQVYILYGKKHKIEQSK